VLKIRRLINAGYNKNNNNNNMITPPKSTLLSFIHSLQSTIDQQRFNVLKHTAIILFRIYIYVSPSGIYRVLFIYFVYFVFTFLTFILIRECVNDWQIFIQGLLSPLSRISSFCTYPDRLIV